MASPKESRRTKPTENYNLKVSSMLSSPSNPKTERASSDTLSDQKALATPPPTPAKFRPPVYDIYHGTVTLDAEGRRIVKDEALFSDIPEHAICALFGRLAMIIDNPKVSEYLITEDKVGSFYLPDHLDKEALKVFLKWALVRYRLDIDGSEKFKNGRRPLSKTAKVSNFRKRSAPASNKHDEDSLAKRMKVDTLAKTGNSGARLAIPLKPKWDIKFIADVYHIHEWLLMRDCFGCGHMRKKIEDYLTTQRPDPSTYEHIWRCLRPKFQAKEQRLRMVLVNRVVRYIESEHKKHGEHSKGEECPAAAEFLKSFKDHGSFMDMYHQRRVEREFERRKIAARASAIKEVVCLSD